MSEKIANLKEVLKRMCDPNDKENYEKPTWMELSPLLLEIVDAIEEANK